VNAEILPTVKNLSISEKNKAFTTRIFERSQIWSVQYYILGAGTREDTGDKIACHNRYYQFMSKLEERTKIYFVTYHP